MRKLSISFTATLIAALRVTAFNTRLFYRDWDTVISVNAQELYWLTAGAEFALRNGWPGVVVVDVPGDTVSEETA